MWPKAYKDYPKDQPLKKERVKAGKGIVGCEMCEANGWGETFQSSKKKEHGLIYSILKIFFKNKDK